jgi:hypothetical protein
MHEVEVMDERFVLMRLVTGELWVTWQMPAGWDPGGPILAAGTYEACDAAKRLMEMP